MSSRRTSVRPVVEWPTLCLACVIYGGWVALTLSYRALPWPLLAALGGWLLAWQMSFQHEVLHGHPTRWRSVNDALGFPPLTLWLPYHLYKASHLRHHRDAYLTDPLEDPESYYLTAERFAAQGRGGRAFLRVVHSFPGRVTLGAMVSLLIFFAAAVAACWRNQGAARRIWLAHGLGVAAVAVWVMAVCGMPLWLYLACFVVPSRMLAAIRSFAEHRAAPGEGERTAIVERAPLLGLLFLHNNLHAVHHARPGLAWYRIPAFYRAHRAAILRENGGLLYRGYFDVARRYLVTPHHVGSHPGFLVPRAPLPGERPSAQASMGYPRAADSVS